jgi:hypothetical protein
MKKVITATASKDGHFGELQKPDRSQLGQKFLDSPSAKRADGCGWKNQGRNRGWKNQGRNRLDGFGNNAENWISLTKSMPRLADL